MWGVEGLYQRMLYGCPGVLERVVLTIIKGGTLTWEGRVAD